MSKYKLIYCDPPWQFSNKKTGGSMKSSAQSKYDTMSIEQMKQMDIASICDDDCVLIMWWVGSMPQEAIDLVNAWGFTIKNMNGFVWNKLTKNRLPFFGMGFWTRAGSESAIIATRGKPKRASGGVRAVGTAVTTRHSEKPQLFRDKCVELCGDVPRLEMFSRGQFEGWEVFGNQCGETITIPMKEKSPE